jgi:LPXTG-motif cell wall-anchored protein
MKRKNKKHKGRSRVDLTKRLAGYSLTAGAVLAAGGKAQAGVIYSGPLDKPFGYDAGHYFLTMEGVVPEAVLDGFHGAGWYGADSSNGFYVMSLGYPYPSYYVNFRVNGAPTYYVGYFNNVAKLSGSQYVGQSTNTPIYQAGGFIWTLTFGGDFYYTGSWTYYDPSGYFGFSFDLEFESESGAPPETTVYGWGLVEGLDARNGRLLGWAYEDSGAEIHVGDTGATPIPVPSALGLAALGAAGVLSIRRRKKA